MKYWFSNLYSRPRPHFPNQKLWKGTSSLCFSDWNKKRSTAIKLIWWSRFSPASPHMGTGPPDWWGFLGHHWIMISKQLILLLWHCPAQFGATGLSWGLSGKRRRMICCYRSALCMDKVGRNHLPWIRVGKRGAGHFYIQKPSKYPVRAADLQPLLSHILACWAATPGSAAVMLTQLWVISVLRSALLDAFLLLPGLTT